MVKGKATVFFCKECGYESSKWMGQCPGCREWNVFVEEPIVKKKSGMSNGKQEFVKPVKLNDINIEETTRLKTGLRELDRVLGGGIVAGSLILVGGDPGIGKSTLLLQVCKNVASQDKKVLYISGEESLKQIKLRAERLGSFSDNLLLLCDTNLESVEDNVRKEMPDMVVIDSIQTMYREDVGSAPGSVSQVRESTAAFMELAKGLGISIFIVGHVTKDGMVAGPRGLEHMVDTVLYFEGDKHASYRLLRGVKNRFGSTNEIGVFEMKQDGLSEVSNPSEFMLQGRLEDASGSITVCLIEGTRPLLVEVQALVSKTNFGMPRRTSNGTDYNRVNLLLAVVEKKTGMYFGECDVYVNVVGGIKVTEPSLDLGIVLALISSKKDKAIDPRTIAFGEVGLSGEIRAVSQTQQRIAEAAKLGFKKCIAPEVSTTGIEIPDGIEVIKVRTIADAVKYI